MSKEKTNRKFTAAIILHDDCDEIFARQLAASLTAATGFTFTSRNARWGCRPKMYAMAFTVNGAVAYGNEDCLRDMVNLKTGDYKGAGGPFDFLSKSQRIDRCVKEVSERVIKSYFSR